MLFIVRLFRDESGQDVIVYALLAAFIGVAGAAAARSILETMAVSYPAWDTAVQALWEMPAPAGP